MRCATRSATDPPRSPICRCRGTARSWPLRHPLDFLGSDGGGGLGARPRHLGRRGAGAEGSGRLPVGVCGDGDFLDGRDRAVDRGALPHSAADRGRQQSLVLQRRSCIRSASRACATGRSRTAGSASASAIRDIDLAAHCARARRAGFGPVDERHGARAHFAEAIAAVEGGASRSSTCASSRAILPAMTAAVTRKADSESEKRRPR